MHKIASASTESDESDEPAPEPVLRRWPGWASLAAGVAFQCTLTFGPFHPMRRGEPDYFLIAVWVALASAGGGLSMLAISQTRALLKLAAYVGFTLFAMVAVVLVKFLMKIF